MTFACGAEYNLRPLTWMCCGRSHCETRRWRWPRPRPGWRRGRPGSHGWWGLQTEGMRSVMCHVSCVMLCHVSCCVICIVTERQRDRERLELLTRHEETQSGGGWLGLVVVVRPALHQRSLIHVVRQMVSISNLGQSEARWRLLGKSGLLLTWSPRLMLATFRLLIVCPFT